MQLASAAQWLAFIPLTTHSRSEDSVFAVSISRHIDKSGAVMARRCLIPVRILYLQSLLPRRSPRCKPAACNFTRTIVVQHVQQTNVFVGNTLTDTQRESVFSGTTALVGVILLPLPPITIAATYLRGSVFIRRRYICIFVCRKPCFLVFTPCGAAGALHSCAEYSAQRYPCGEQQG